MDSESDFEYEDEDYSHFRFDFNQDCDKSNDIYNDISDDKKLHQLLEHHHLLYSEKINKYWWVLIKSHVARAHWKKYAYLWLGKRYTSGILKGQRIVDKTNLERGRLAQIKYQKEVAAPYRKLFLLRKFPLVIARIIYIDFLSE